MSRSVFGWDLPPGVRASDIPGNRPEDEAWENIYNNFWDKERLTKTHIGTLITEQEYDLMEKLFYPKATDKRMVKASEVIDNYIMAAIEYGIEVGSRQAEDYHQQNRFYETQFIAETLEKAGISQEVISKVMDILNGKYETP